VIEPLEKALPFQLRKGFPDGLADELAVPNSRT